MRYSFKRFIVPFLSLAVWLHAAPDSSAPKKVLFFTKSSGFEHSVIKEPDGKESFASKRLAELGSKIGITFVTSKDGSLFSPAYLAQFDAFVFYTTGNLLEAGTDGKPPLTESGKAALLAAIEGGKGFVGLHAATDTFHTGETVEMDKNKTGPSRYRNLGDKADPYTRMIGAEFIVHNAQQVANVRVIDPHFPGFGSVGNEIECLEEWYSLTDFSSDLHVLLVQETNGMKGAAYQRPPYPMAWARLQGKGRVFYTSMGHREDVWTNPAFEQILSGGLKWTTKQVDADVTPNLAKAAPSASTLPPDPKQAAK